MAGYSVVIPARDAARTLGRVLDALAAQEPAPAEVIVVDDGSTDATAQIAAERTARGSLSTGGGRFAGGARNAGWEEARGDAVVFLDADVVPAPGWGAGVARALAEFPGALVGCARTFDADTPWGWVATCRSRRRTCRSARRASAASSRPSACSCRATRRCAGTRATAARTRSSAPTRSRPACGSSSTRASRPRTSTSAAPSATCGASSGGSRTAWRARCRSSRAGSGVRSGACRSTTSRSLRLPVVYRRVAGDPRAARPLPRGAAPAGIAEWTLGASALRYAARRPALRGGSQPHFRVSAKPILVTGAHRSGTTWVGKMLALAPGVAYIHEPFNPRTAAGLSPARFDRYFTVVTRENEARYRPGLEQTIRFRYGLGAAAALAARSRRRRAHRPRPVRVGKARLTGRDGRSSRIRSRCSRPSGSPSASGWTWSC